MHASPLNTLLLRVPGLAKCFVLALSLVTGMAQLPAQTVYFDQNGSTAGFGFDRDVTYNWNTTDTVWNTDSTGGGGGAISTWNNAGNNRAYFDLVSGEYGGLPNGLPLTVNLEENVTVGGISLRQRGNWGGMVIQAASSRDDNVRCGRNR